jgi:hypothetical protein
MKKVSLVLTSLIIIGLMTCCGGTGSGKDKSDKGKNKPGVAMTLKAEGKVEFTIRGENMASVDWGDGSPVDSAELRSSWKCEHTYAQAAEYTIKVNGAIKELLCDRLKLTELEVNLPTLVNLFCAVNSFTALDLSDCPELEWLQCFQNKSLTSLELSKNTKLKVLQCQDSPITSLDVSNNTALTELDCGETQITSLDISKNSELKSLFCGRTSLTSLDISNNTALKHFNCSNTQITNLIVGKNTMLETMYFLSNKVTNLDVSNFTALGNLTCDYNPLTGLDVSNNGNLFILSCMGNQLSEDALNALFNTLHSNADIGKGAEKEKVIIIRNNPGTATCDRSIAEKKGWKVQ